MLVLLDFNGTITENLDTNVDTTTAKPYDPRHPVVVLVSNHPWCLVIYSGVSIAIQAILCIGLWLRLGSSVCVSDMLAW